MFYALSWAKLSHVEICDFGACLGGGVGGAHVHLRKNFLNVYVELIIFYSSESVQVQIIIYNFFFKMLLLLYKLKVLSSF